MDAKSVRLVRLIPTLGTLGRVLKALWFGDEIPAERLSVGTLSRILTGGALSTNTDDIPAQLQTTGKISNADYCSSSDVARGVSQICCERIEMARFSQRPYQS